MTTLKVLAAVAGAILLAGCTAAAEDTPTKAVGPAYGPGWRHEQMVKAWQKGDVPPAPMMGMAGTGLGYGPRGPGMAGNGPPLKDDGTIDTAKLPPWCPLGQNAK